MYFIEEVAFRVWIFFLHNSLGLLLFSCSVSDSLWLHGCSTQSFPVLHYLRSLLKLMSIQLVMPSNYFILHCPLLLLPSVFPSIRIFSKESAVHLRWPKYWSFSFNISPTNEHQGLNSFRMEWWIALQSKGLSRVFSNTTVQKHQLFSALLFYIVQLSNIYTWLLEKP